MIQFLSSLPQRLLGIPARNFCRLSKQIHRCAHIPKRVPNLPTVDFFHLSKQPHMRAHIPKRVPNLPTVDFFRLSKQPHIRAHIPKRVPNLLKRVKFMFSIQHQIEGRSHVPFGVTFFEELVKQNIFIDKTNFIYEMLRQTQTKRAILICRPRRWGKSLQLDMLRVYFKVDVTVQGKRKYKSISILKQPMANSTIELKKYYEILKEYLKEQNEDQLKDEIEEELQRFYSQDQNLGIQAALDKIVKTKVESREMVKLISGKMKDLNEEQLRKFILSFIDWKIISQTILLHQKIVLEKKISQKASQEELKNVKTLIKSKQNKNIQNKLSQKLIWADMIQNEINEIKNNEILTKVGLVILNSLSKKDLIALLQRQLTQKDCQSSIEEMKQKLKNLAECQNKSKFSIQELTRLIEVQVRQTILSLKRSSQYRKFKENIVTQVKHDEIRKALIEKKRQKSLFYGKNSLNITKYEENEGTISENSQNSAGNIKKQKQIIKKDIEYYYMGEYPIIFLTLPDLERASTLQDMKNKIKGSISTAYKEHQYLTFVLEDFISKEKIQSAKNNIIKQREQFQRILNDNGTNSTDQDIQSSLTFLSRLLYRHFGKKVIYLIDEFDRPYYSSVGKQSSDLIQKYMTDILSKALKQDKNAEKLILTGIIRIYGAGLFSGMNNIIQFDMNTHVSNSLNKNLGFVQEDVDYLVSKVVEERSGQKNANQLNRENLKQIVKKWCNGYYINKNYVYNPWSVCALLSFPDEDYDNQFPDGWTSTGHSGIIKKLILKEPYSTQLENLITKDKIIIEEMPTKIDLKNIDQLSISGNLFYFLFHCGFLTRVEGTKNEFKIPNLQIKKYFYKEVVKDWINNAFGINANIFQSLAKELVENITNNQKVRKIIKTFLAAEVKNNALIQESLKNWRAKKKVKIYEFDIATFFMIMTFWYRQYFENQTVFTLAKPEFITENQKKIDYLFIPSQSGPSTVVVFEFKLVPLHIRDQEKKATKELENGLWQILANDYFLEGIKICQQSNKTYLKSIKIVSMVVYSQYEVWIQSHTFTKEKGRQLSNIFETFVKKQGEPINQTEKTAVRTQLIDGPLKTEINLQDKRKKLLSMEKCQTLQQLLAKYQFETETLKQEQQLQERQQNNQDNSISKESSKEEIRKRSKRRIKRTMSPENEK